MVIRICIVKGVIEIPGEFVDRDACFMSISKQEDKMNEIEDIWLIILTKHFNTEIIVISFMICRVDCSSLSYIQ